MNAPHADPTADEKIVDEASIRYEGWPVVGVCFLVATFAWAAGFTVRAFISPNYNAFTAGRPR